MKAFNAEQTAAIETSSRHTLVLAGAGTGKTTTITGRCSHLIRSGVPEKKILLITFTRKSASELKSRIRGARQKRAHVFASTFHSWAMRMIRQNPKIFGMERSTLIDPDDATSVYRRFRRQQTAKRVPTARELSSFHSLVVNTRKTNEEVCNILDISKDDFTVYVNASKFYRAFKAARNYLDYDDILECVAVRLKDIDLAAAVGERFSHIMIDEMQDTNPLQYMIIDALAPYVNLFCVGDDAQSIYRFRGADFESIHAFKTRYPEATVLKLRENYRSTQEILDVSNWLMKQSSLQYDKQLRAARGSGQRPILRDFEDQWGQADYVTDTIVEAFKEEERWSNNMVLVRTGYGARPIESRFLESGVPYVLIGGQSLFGARHVKDVMALLRIYANRHDELAWMRYLQLWKGLGEATAEKIFRSVGLDESPSLGFKVSGESLETIVSDYAKLGQHEWARPVLRCLASSAEPAVLLDAALDALESRLAEVYQNEDWEVRRRDFLYIRDLASRHRSIEGFVEEYLLNPVYEKEGERTEVSDAVKIITIHSAKGLEANRCFVVDVARGTYPRPGATTEEAEEERRVLYVGLTRAANELHITRAERGWASYAPGKDAHYFLENLPFELVDYDGGSSDGEADGSMKIRF